MSDKRDGILKRPFEAMASLRLAIVLMVVLGFICIVATFYESSHGTAAAQRDFYATPWFSLLLGLLGVNLLFSMLKRHPWTIHHAGFVLAHIGILLLLLGSVVSLRFGLDSTMALYEGDETDRVSLPPAAGPDGAAPARGQELVVPFRVALLRFNSDKYPGSGMAATYESWVRIDDPERGVFEHHISMNHPLHYRGYIFFQASFVEGQPMMSIFSVTRAPGLPLVYAGVVLVSLGVAWMFYLKPYFARRQGQAALEARSPRGVLPPAALRNPLARQA